MKMYDATDKTLAKTGLTLTVTASKAGAAFASISPTVTEISSGWYKVALTSSHTDTLGELIIRATASGADDGEKPCQVVPERATAAALNVVDDFIDTEVAAIKAKTDNLPSDPADASDIAASFSTVNSTLTTIAGYIDTEVGAIKAKTDNLPSDPADASDIASSFSTVNSTLATIAGYLDTEVAAIKAKTDNLPTDPADASDIAAAFASLDTKVDTIDSNVDSILADTGTDGVVVNAASLATDAVTEIVTAVWAKVLESEGSITAGEAVQALVAEAFGITEEVSPGVWQFKTPNGNAVRIEVTLAGSPTERQSVTLTP